MPPNNNNITHHIIISGIQYEISLFISDLSQMHLAFCHPDSGIEKSYNNPLTTSESHIQHTLFKMMIWVSTQTHTGVSSHTAV